MAPLAVVRPGGGVCYRAPRPGFPHPRPAMLPLEAPRAAAGPDLSRVFAAIYDTDLVYRPGCWTLCGDAHCCSFRRHKARFRLMARDGGQELPLLPGEFDFLAARGWTAQFEPYERERRVHDFGPARLVVDRLTSRRPGGCACDHATRTTVCRLYPLLPVLGPDGGLVATERLGLYEELEALDGADPACRVDALPFDQLALFLRIAGAIGGEPILAFHLEAYRLAKRHVASRLADAVRPPGGDPTAPPRSAFQAFEAAFLRRRLVDAEVLDAELAALWARFRDRHGRGFTEPLETLTAALA